MMITCLIVGWLLLGTIGYFLMRQGFLVDFEDALGERGAWGPDMILLGIVSVVLLGPLFILMAFIIKGKNCIKRRTA